MAAVASSLPDPSKPSAGVDISHVTRGMNRPWLAALVLELGCLDRWQHQHSTKTAIGSLSHPWIRLLMPPSTWHRSNFSLEPAPRNSGWSRCSLRIACHHRARRNSQGTQQRIFKDNGNGPATAIDACILMVFPSQELNFLFFCILETRLTDGPGPPSSTRPSATGTRYSMP
jgi:hypothetical protein